MFYLYFSCEPTDNIFLAVEECRARALPNYGPSLLTQLDVDDGWTTLHSADTNPDAQSLISPTTPLPHGGVTPAAGLSPGTSHPCPIPPASTSSLIGLPLDSPRTLSHPPPAAIQRQSPLFTPQQTPTSPQTFLHTSPPRDSPLPSPCGSPP